MAARQITAVIAMGAGLVGCVGPRVEHIRVDPDRAGNLLAGVRTVSAAELKDKRYTTVQPLRATSCKNKLWDPDATEEDTTNQLRIMAARSNANALTHLYCEAPKGVDLVSNCWTAVVCHASAIRIDD